MKYGVVSRIVSPMSARAKRDGSGTYDAMNVELELDDLTLVQVMSFKELTLGQQVEVEQNGKYWNIVQKPRSLDKPGSVNNTEVLGAIRTLYALVAKIDNKVDSVVKEILPTETPVKQPATSHLGGVPSNSWEQTRARFTDDGLPQISDKRPEVDPLIETKDGPVNLDDIPF